MNCMCSKKSLVFFILLVSVVCFNSCFAGGMTGAYSELAVDKKEVIDAADFAVLAQAKVMVYGADEQQRNLNLLEIIKAEQQVVSGVNYRMTLKVDLDGVEKMADVVVWWQEWRTPEQYELSNWEWKQ